MHLGTEMAECRLRQLFGYNKSYYSVVKCFAAEHDAMADAVITSGALGSIPPCHARSEDVLQSNEVLRRSRVQFRVPPLGFEYSCDNLAQHRRKPWKLHAVV